MGTVEDFPFWRQLEAVRARPDFVAFSSLIGIRARSGRFQDALAMLVDVGAPEALAYSILAGWPTKKKRALPAEVLTLAEEAACRLAHFIPGFERYDWPTLIKRAAGAAERQREEPARESSQALAGDKPKGQA